MIRLYPLLFLLVYGQQEKTTLWEEWEECDYQVYGYKMVDFKF